VARIAQGDRDRPLVAAAFQLLTKPDHCDADDMVRGFQAIFDQAPRGWRSSKKPNKGAKNQWLAEGQGRRWARTNSCARSSAWPSESCGPSQIHRPRGRTPPRGRLPLSPRASFMAALYERIVIGIDPLSGSRLSFRAQMYAGPSSRSDAADDGVGSGANVREAICRLLPHDL
jgi:hypothetical protein